MEVALSNDVHTLLGALSQLAPSLGGLRPAVRFFLLSLIASSCTGQRPCGAGPSAARGSIPGRVEYHVPGGGRSSLNPGQSTGQQGLTVVLDEESGAVITVIKRGSDFVPPQL